MVQCLHTFCFVWQAACIWLLTLVKKCGQHSIIQSKLSQLQSAFMSMLSENDGEKLASINQIKYSHQSPVYYSEDINILCTTYWRSMCFGGWSWYSSYWFVFCRCNTRHRLQRAGYDLRDFKLTTEGLVGVWTRGDTYHRKKVWGLRQRCTLYVMDRILEICGDS